MNIVITDANTLTDGDISLNAFADFGSLQSFGLTAPEEVNERIREAEVILCNKTPLNENTLSNAEKLKYIGLFATGYNNVDLAYTASRGITVCNSPGYSTDSVAQHTFALILQIYSKVSVYNESVKKGDWIKSPAFSYFPYPIYELAGKTIGIIGFGAIGQRVYSIAKAFGMKAVVCTRTEKPGFEVEYLDFDRLLQVSDIVTVHCLLNSQTENLFDKAAFERMKKDSVFINTARGPIVDEVALRDALTSGHLRGAGIDVLCSEPMSSECVLQCVENCVITPHVAWAGLETRQRLLETVYNNLKCFIEGNPINIVR